MGRINYRSGTSAVAMTNPIQQGLKQRVMHLKLVRRLVAMTNPIQQGLKREEGTTSSRSFASRND